MTAPVNQPNQVIPDLNLLFQNKKFEIKSEINCIAIGTIESFNTTNQTVTVQINYLRVIYGGVAQTNSENVNNQTQNYPQLINCPLMMLFGGSGYLTFPIVKGDSCVVLFNDRDLDAWWSTGSSNSVPNSARVHDLSDGLVFVGVKASTNSLTQYNTLGPQLGMGINFLAVEALGLRLQANAVTLRVALDALCAALLAFTDSDGDTLSPTTAAAIAAAQVLIDTVLI
jgi:hypothetical protein